MEKHKAHYDLEAVKAAVLVRGIDAFTATAVRGLDEMGLGEVEGLSVVLGLQRGMLFKSMTTNRDHRVWQDVYHAPCPNDKTAYIKLTMQAGALVIQFKEL
jgi:motility quorum-sensing regulator/GCU-specific mRNA interferase toxin